jgi:integrase
MRLTQATVAQLKLPDGKIDAIFFDDRVPGFGVRLRAGGSSNFVFQFKFGPVLRRMVLGRTAAMKAEAARDLAERHYAAVKDGRDPSAERAVRTAHAANTFGGLVHGYLKFKQSRLRPRSLLEVRRHLEVYAKPLHRLPVVSIDKTIIANQIKHIAEHSGVVAANRMRASLSAMYSWALKETDFVTSNPVINTHKAGEEKPRTRLLSDTEIKVIWAALDDGTFSTILRLLLLTALRLSEISALHWQEVDFARNRLMLSADRTKNARVHHVPMAPIVRKLLEDLWAKRPEGQALVFPSGKGSFSGWTRARKALDRRIVEQTGSALLHWTPHDCRRTAATRMAEDLQIQPHVIEEILGHSSGHKAGIVAVYNLATYAAEQDRALTLWSQHIAGIVEGRSNVTPMKRA